MTCHNQGKPDFEIKKLFAMHCMPFKASFHMGVLSVISGFNLES